MKALMLIGQERTALQMRYANNGKKVFWKTKKTHLQKSICLTDIFMAVLAADNVEK